MANDKFIEQHKTAWQRLEELLKLLDRSSMRRLHREEVRSIINVEAADEVESDAEEASRVRGERE